jgi:hypothetical protein
MGLFGSRVTEEQTQRYLVQLLFFELDFPPPAFGDPWQPFFEVYFPAMMGEEGAAYMEDRDNDIIEIFHVRRDDGPTWMKKMNRPTFESYCGQLLREFEEASKMISTVTGLDNARSLKARYDEEVSKGPCWEKIPDTIASHLEIAYQKYVAAPINHTVVTEEKYMQIALPRGKKIRVVR